MLIENIHNKKHFNRKLLCNGIIPLTPVKQAENFSTGQSAPAPPTASPCSPSRQSSSSPPDQIPAITHSTPSTVPANIAQPEPLPSNVDLIRRHSLSLRSPPLGSLAKEILASSSTVEKTNSILNEIKTMREQLSDFGSCVSFTSSSDEEKGRDSSSQNNQWQMKKKKRKNSRSPPDKSYFLKKLNSGNRLEPNNLEN